LDHHPFSGAARGGKYAFFCFKCARLVRPIENPGYARRVLNLIPALDQAVRHHLSSQFQFSHRARALRRGLRVDVPTVSSKVL
jgi:hypothetical protein